MKEEEKDYEVISDEFSQYDMCFKIILIGDSGVGKSSLTLRAIKKNFTDFYAPTVGFEFYSFNIKYKDQKIKLQIWDTCGQEVYRSLISSFYRNSSLAMIVYSIDNDNSFKNVESWLDEIKGQINPDVKIFLIGNKNDLQEKRQVSTEEGEQLAKEHNFHYFLETSAKTGFNAEITFVQAAKMLYDESIKYIQRTTNYLNSPPSTSFTEEERNNIKLEHNDDDSPKRKIGCRC